MNTVNKSLEIQGDDVIEYECEYNGDVIGGCMYMARQYALEEFGKGDGFETQKNTLENEYGISLDEWRESLKNDGSNLMSDLIKNGDIRAGMSILANCMMSKESASAAKEIFMSADNDVSMYAFLREVTGDKSNTKDAFMAAAKNELGIGRSTGAKGKLKAAVADIDDDQKDNETEIAFNA